jgi:RNA polymerase sigma-70 factor (ECF subfamily)
MNTPDTESAWNQHHATVYRYLRRRLPSPELAEDLAQETFLRLHHTPPQGAAPVQLRAWLLRTARNLIVDHYRAQRDEVGIDASLAADRGNSAVSLRMLEPCITPLAGRLPEHYRIALLWDLAGMPQQEIAERQNIGLSGAKSRVQRARTLLQHEFQRCCRYHFDHDDVLVGYTARSGGPACAAAGAD